MKPCLIIGNGPSFNEIPAGVLESMPSFGMNYCGFQPTYYVCVDSDVLEHSDKIFPLAEAAQIAYISGLNIRSTQLHKLPNVEFVYKDTASFRAEQYMSGFTAAYVCLKMAYYAGFDEIHLWGIDHSPTWEHYKAGYPAGHTTRARMDVMKWHFQLAANVYARAGRTIYNHSHPSKLDAIFRRG